MTIWSILRPLVYFVVIWYIFPRFGILDQEKSGNTNPKGDHGKNLFFGRLLHIGFILYFFLSFSVVVVVVAASVVVAAVTAAVVS
jgi:hypothetical protein